MVGIWNGTVTMIERLVISCRTCSCLFMFVHDLLVHTERWGVGGSFSGLWGWDHQEPVCNIRVSVFSCVDADDEAVDCCSNFGPGRDVDTDNNNTGHLRDESNGLHQFIWDGGGGA